jgi:lipopolysaccharide export system permease protein
MTIFSNFIVPEANYRMKKTLMIITRKNPSLNLREHIFNRIYDNYTIWAERIDQSKGELKNVQFIEKVRGKEKRIITSMECNMKVSKDTLFLRFLSGEIHEIDENIPSKYRVLNFKVYIFKIPLPEENSIRKVYRGKREMTIIHILNELKKVKDKNMRWRYLIEINKNFAIPFASILFVLVGSGIGMGARIGGLSVGVTTSFFIFIIYYIFLVGGEELAERGILNPNIGIWIPNLFLLIMGIIIYKREIYGK